MAGEILKEIQLVKLLPWWDPLRRDPRFEQIVNSLAQGSRSSSNHAVVPRLGPKAGRLSCTEMNVRGASVSQSRSERVTSANAKYGCEPIFPS